MSTAHTTSTAAKPRRASVAKAPDAIKLLKADHKEVKTLFQAYDKLVKAKAGGDKKKKIAQQICAALTVHATIEEALFYPAARAVLGADADLVDEADVEHASAKDLIAQIEAAAPGDELYDAKVKVLGEYIDHHVKEEETEMFPKVAKKDIDLDALGAALKQRKDELTAERAS